MVPVLILLCRRGGCGRTSSDMGNVAHVILFGVLPWERVERQFAHDNYPHPEDCLSDSPDSGVR